MIRATFYEKENRLIGFEITGHADFGPHGQDIVCAGVSSAVQLTINAIKEILSEKKARVLLKENLISINIEEVSSESRAEDFLKALRLHLELMAEDYENTIELKLIREV